MDEAEPRYGIMTSIRACKNGSYTLKYKRKLNDKSNRLRLLNNVALLRNVETVQEFSDILVSYSADLLDVGGGLGDVFERVSGKGELVLDVLGLLNIDTLVHSDSSDNLLANEVTAVE